jgi:hypothetical protein
MFNILVCVASHSLYPNTPRSLPHESCFLQRRSATLQGSKNKKQQQGQRSLKKGGLAYQIDFAAADPDLYMPKVPYPEDFPEADLIIGRGYGETESGIKFAKFNDGSSTGGDANVKIESLMPRDLYLGQIVPFEIEITVTDLEAPEDGDFQFIAGWSIITTSGGAFGYNETIGVLAAFVDIDDGAHIDPGNDASVSSFSWSIVNDDEIQGVFDMTGLDSGDVVVVEVWVVIQDIFPEAGATGNVHSRLIDDATTSQDDKINTGTQTVPMMALGSAAGGPADGSYARFGVASEDEALCEEESSWQAIHNI